MNSIEIFSGAGGLAKGLELAGTNHLAFIEWNADACRTLRANFNPNIVFEGDIRLFPFDDYDGIDVIAGGPPCQPFSLGGKALGNNDKRDMFPSAITAIRTLMPKAFIFENVKGLLRESFSEYFNFILLQLAFPQVVLPSNDWKLNFQFLRMINNDCTYKGKNYDVTYHLVNAADYGIPQNRERVFIVGFRTDLKIDWSFPSPTHSKDSLLWDMFVNGMYWKRHNLSNYFESNVVSSTRKRLITKYGLFEPQLKPWRTVRDALSGLGEPNNQGDHVLREGAREYHGHTGSNIDEPSKTIKAGAHGIPGGENMIKFENGSVRYYSIAEAKRIQTFPDNYIILGSWTEGMRQLGNAVPVELAKIIATSVFNALNDHE